MEEALGVADVGLLYQNAIGAADLGVEGTGERTLSLGAQAGGALLDDGLLQLRFIVLMERSQ